MLLLKIHNLLPNLSHLFIVFYIIIFTFFSGAVYAQVEVTSELSKIRAQDLKTLAKEIEPNVSLVAPKKINPQITSPDNQKIVQLAEKTVGLESITYQIDITILISCQKIFIARVVNCYDLSWSPDSSKIVFSEGTLVHLADSDGFSQQVIYTGPGGPYPGACFDFTWSQDGRRLSFIQLESVHDSSLAHPKRITLLLGELAPPNR
jgi:hypothetical protein